MEKRRHNKHNKLQMLLRKQLNKHKPPLMLHRQKQIMKEHQNPKQLRMLHTRQQNLHNKLHNKLKMLPMQLSKLHLKEIRKVHSKQLKMQYLMQTMLNNLEMKHNNRLDNKVSLIKILIQHWRKLKGQNSILIVSLPMMLQSV